MPKGVYGAEDLRDKKRARVSYGLTAANVAPSFELEARPCAGSFPYMIPRNSHHLHEGRWREGWRGKPWHLAGDSVAKIAIIYGAITMFSVACHAPHVSFFPESSKQSCNVELRPPFLMEL